MSTLSVDVYAEEIFILSFSLGWLDTVCSRHHGTGFHFSGTEILWIQLFTWLTWKHRYFFPPCWSQPLLVSLETCSTTATVGDIIFGNSVFLNDRMARFRCLKVTSWQNYSIICLLKYPWYWHKFLRDLGKILEGKVFVSRIGNGCNFGSSRVADSINIIS